MTQMREIRGDHAVTIAVPAAAAGSAVGGAWIAPFRARIAAARWVPGGAITAHATNYATLSFRNRGAAGAGSVQWATARSYASGNGALSTPETLTLSGTAANLEVAEGDVLAVEVTHSGTGLALPGGAVLLTLRSLG
ncbi:hypothetical protein [Actinomadura flavalba]|uniref:hypothetical protein n=1 Tax=Actinomadura flavalba TaxID=1120938 RepID=UPI0003708C24|nr:hypothetical protein [Actinomadura flavalba]